MRRRKFGPDDVSVYNQIVTEAEVGYLGILTNDGYPRVIPLDFVAIVAKIYFHGAVKGEKYSLLSKKPKVTFSVNLPLSVIPSNWIDAKGASHLFKSVLIKGKGSVVEDSNEKCLALQKLMEKYQPEGGYPEVKPKEKFYQKILPVTAVFRIDADSIDTYVKLPTDKPEELQRELIKKLRSRGTDIDFITANEIEHSMTDDN
jgi:nitroimidazol reductase NimA-like FMN-containing flavoprotein (pyridoxamine 5'-phosphate oxidase superfamily)